MLAAECMEERKDTEIKCPQRLNVYKHSTWEDNFFHASCSVSGQKNNVILPTICMLKYIQKACTFRLSLGQSLEFFQDRLEDTSSSLTVQEGENHGFS